MSGVCFLCQRELPTHSDACQAAPLYQRISDLTEESCGMEDEIDEYKDASGLMVGGDPGGVTPAILREHQGTASAVIIAAKRECSRHRDADEETPCELCVALDAYLKRWPEQ